MIRKDEELTWQELCDFVFNKVKSKLKSSEQKLFKKWFMERESVGYCFDPIMVLRCFRIWQDLKNDLDHFVVLSGREGFGKCQPKDSLVLMANGEFKKIQDVKVGEFVLSPQEDGSYIYAKVKATNSYFSDKVYSVVELNRNKKKLYECSHNHLIPFNYKVHPRKNGIRNCKDSFWIIKNYDAEYYSNLKHHTKKESSTLSAFAIPSFRGRDNCEIEPYTLGIFLGDGCFSSGNFSITTSDKVIIDYINNHYKVTRITKRLNNKASSYHLSKLNQLAKSLIKYGLKNKKSGDKFIPKEALLSDLKYRQKLFAGLVDSDGYAHGNNYSFTQKSKRLIEDIRYLIYSLGGRTGKISKVKKSIKKSNFVGEYYQITCYIGNLSIPLLTKKKHIKDNFFYLSANRVSVDIIKSKPNLVHGIEVDSPSKWYITDNFMITHNSTLSFQIAAWVNPDFDLNNIAYNAKTYLDIMSRKQEEVKKSDDKIKTESLVMDEGTELLSRESLNLSNRILTKTFFVQRALKFLILVNVPNFFMVDVVLRLHRVRTLIDVIDRGKYKCITGKGIKLVAEFGQKTKNIGSVKLPNGSFWHGTFNKAFPKAMDYDEYYRNKIDAIGGLLETLKDDAVQMKMITAAKVAKEIGCSDETIKRMIKKGDVEGKMIGSKYYITRKAYDKLLTP